MLAELLITDGGYREHRGVGRQGGKPLCIDDNVVQHRLLHATCGVDPAACEGLEARGAAVECKHVA